MTRIKRLAFALCIFSTARLALAAAQFSTTANPGFYQFKVSDYQVTALSDGVSKLPAKELLLNEPDSDIEKALRETHSDYPVSTSVNTYLVNTGKKLMLFDKGTGDLLGDALGKLASNHKLAGYLPGQVDEIYITHLHPGHMGGLSLHGQQAFPNAKLWIEKHEADYWLNPENEAKESQINRPFFAQTAQMQAPYRAKGRVNLFTRSSLGDRVTATGGHTPGHVVLQGRKSRQDTGDRRRQPVDIIDVGHYSPATKNDIITEREYLVELHRQALELVRQGQP